MYYKIEIIHERLVQITHEPDNFLLKVFTDVRQRIRGRTFRKTIVS